MSFDYKKYRYLLLTVLASSNYGFKERKDKTCVNYRVFDNGQDTIIVPAQGGRYELFYSASNEAIRGDVFALINYCEFGKTQPANTVQRDQVFDIISKIASVTLNTDTEFQPYQSIHGGTVGEKKIFGYQTIGSNFFPYIAKDLFVRRGFDPMIPKPFIDAVGMFEKEVKYSGKKYQQLGFLWRNQEGECLGIQSKFLDVSGRCVKLFEAGSQKGESLFYTEIKQGGSVLICEDPFDAMAHYHLYKDTNKDMGYICTGGTPSVQQISLMYNLIEKFKAKVFLGNDNDLAGQITNLKIIDKNQGLKIVKNQDISVYVTNKETGNFLFEGELEGFKQFVVKCAARKKMAVEFPLKKDWNDDLLFHKQAKIRLLKMVEKAMQISVQHPTNKSIIPLHTISR